VRILTRYILGEILSQTLIVHMIRTRQIPFIQSIASIPLLLTTFIVMAIALAAMQATAFAIIAYGYVASAVCVLLGPIFIPFFIVPKMDWLFWGWLKAFLGFSFYQVVAAAFTFVFSKVLLGMLAAIGPLSLSNAFTILPALLVTLFVCIYGLIKIPELTASIFGGRSGSWVNPLG